ncbi:aldehyde dehydrogenase (NADP(+)) [Endozoicomonas arenosclerae]|uniref:aldehyde dehydrogenase (NADP(+)) n=1 Tax=Endozoicomonas arenosclerae TaxID=1633495 RepID=UPI0007840AD4|nr:aldehyde dehydrogenase (NADP(+)) [Endozoicomonas arenosclerae]
MSIAGKLLLGQDQVQGQGSSFQAINPATHTETGPVYGSATQADVNKACTLASEAFGSYRRTSPEQRAHFLDRLADRIEQLDEELVTVACSETGLPAARIQGEKGRTIGQIRMFAEVVRTGLWQSPTLDSALPDRQPLPRPDLRRSYVPLGPVAVFGASNFPLAFSVAGGDTVSALAAGAPVVVKAHSAHPGTSEIMGRALQQAIKDCNLHPGTFSLLFDKGLEVAEQLVTNPAIKAVGFTGSQAGGEALMRLAAARPEPIPVFAEMGSTNPVYLLPDALNTRASEFAEGYSASLTMGAGQFCTNPGLLIAIDSPQLNSLIDEISQKLDVTESQTMLTPGIYRNYVQKVDKLLSKKDITVHTSCKSAIAANQCHPMLFSVTSELFLNDNSLGEEVFGPSAMVVRCKNLDEMLNLTRNLEGQLTATIHCQPKDHDSAEALLHELELKAGRILFNGFPTGVEVSHAMVHGGPYPAASDSRGTSVGSSAIQRFLRPVCYQNTPETLLPQTIDSKNSLNLRRLQDGRYNDQ